jgi:exopolyphosphatase/guanosine-5'-triphosphate,3'-diphosphate pyrophosphatase
MDAPKVEPLPEIIQEEILGFIDLGTNSIRLLLVRLNPNRSYSLLLQQRQMVRLGEGAQVEGYLEESAMERTIRAARSFADMAASYGAREVVAVATAGARNAQNGEAFLQRLREETGLDMRIISGREEARLIYLGVSEDIQLHHRRGLFVDIGGGSTELSVGDQKDYYFLDSLHLGAIRMSSLYAPASETGPIAQDRLNLMKNYVRNSVVRSIQKIRELKPEICIGSSGTILSLAGVAARRRGDSGQTPRTLKLEELRGAVHYLASLSLEERRRTPGLNPERGDIIVPGGMVLITLMEEAGISQLYTSERGLREGLLVDYLRKIGLFEGMSIREKSIFQMGRSCRFNEEHARRVASLATDLFDEAGRIGLHSFGEWERELLYYAGILHDIGMFISFSGHQAHSHYIIRHAELLGFDQTEIAIMAALALYHRKKLPRKKHEAFRMLDERSQKVVFSLCAFLRMAESLDRGHAGVVSSLRMEGSKKKVLLLVKVLKDSPLELWGIREHVQDFRRIFRKTLSVDFSASA